MSRLLPRAAHALVAAALLSAVAPPLRAQDLAELRGQLELRIAASGADVGLYFRDLTGPDSLAIGADQRFHAASTMKVPVMIQVYREVDARRLQLTERLPVVNRFRSIADSSSYALDAADDSDSSLYARVGQTMPVRDLVELMITVSSNLATNILIDRVRADSVRATLRDIGADSVTVLRGVEDGAAYRAGMNNTTTARGMGIVMAAIADGRAASAMACGEMVRVLRRQRFRTGIPAGLPRGAAAAHKTGWLTGTDHDAAIVYWRDRPRFVLVVLTRGIQDQRQSSTLIAELTALVFAHAVPEANR
jgi:beta-lactamase class A